VKIDGLPGEKEIFSFKLVNGHGWLTTHRLVIQEEEYDPNFKIMQKKCPDLHLLRNFEKAQIKDQVVTTQIKDGRKVRICLPVFSPSLFKEVKDYIEEAEKCCKQ
jgi:hypothetical protein